ncbi:MAG TPA: glycosyltransferase family 4 protein [Candidatus Binataceae bacterium]|nr:glycosyltransferase family 4 protein [Candidatus Binataceae bacterium]
MKPPYLIVSGDFVKAGGMNQPNYELARYLADEGFETHLAGYRVADDLARHPGVTFHRVPKPAGSYFLSQPLMNRLGRHWARAIAAANGRVIVNGACCDWYDINWVHHVQAVFAPQVTSGWTRRLKNRAQRRVDLAAERRIVPRARLAITDTERMKRDIVERLGFAAERAHAVYLGIDPTLFRPPTADERAAARARIGADRADSMVGRPLVAFVGALGDTRKGFDTLFGAWAALCTKPAWDADLAVVAMGAELAAWKARAASAGIASRIHFLGFERDDAFVARVLWGCDALVLPSRYEGYGRPVQEALCCGLPALVSRASGIAEQYPAELADLIIPDAEDVADLAARLARWRNAADAWREKIRPFSAALRDHTWRKMAEQIVASIERDRSRSSYARDSRPGFAA